MRNIFDQYKAHENRLTHALACCLSEDTRLLRGFIQCIAGEQSKKRANLEVVEQHVPGQPVSDSDDEDGLGLPDMWIYDRDDERWSLIIESKVAAPVDDEELRRHCRTARRNGFEEFTLLVISPEIPVRRLSGITYRTWTEVFTWMRREADKSQWAVRFVDYIEIAEARMASDGYLGDRTLTRFGEIHFDDDHPYSYREAKRILRLLMPELRQREDLRRLGIDPQGKGRKAIKGKGAAEVWDFIPLNEARGQGHFTTYPHLTVAMQERRLLALVMVPDKSAGRYRRNLVKLEIGGLRTLVAKVEQGVTRAVGTIEGAHPLIHVAQRHPRPGSRVELLNDALLEFDLRTALPGDECGIKHQPQWLDATYGVLAPKRSNLTLGIGAALPYGSKDLQSRKVLDTIAHVWIACDPWLQCLLRTD